jgi:hypothetical protein
MIPAPIRQGLQHLTRLKPAFIIIGAQRAGTTSLYSYLCAHPAILPARRKELHFSNRGFAQGMQWYRAQFPAWIDHRERWGKRTLTGESTPAYLFHPLAAGRIQQSLPDVTLIALLRNPVDRAFSHYQHGLRAGYESLMFERQLPTKPPGSRANARKCWTIPITTARITATILIWRGACTLINWNDGSGCSRTNNF